MSKRQAKGYERDIVGDGVHSIQKVIGPHQENSNRIVKYVSTGSQVAPPPAFLHIHGKINTRSTYSRLIHINVAFKSI